jgi:crossover junction endodeoxyribonuclease RuvC
MSNKLIIGIDPGISGGLACLDGAGNVVRLSIMPIVKIGTKHKLDPHGIIDWLRECYTDDNIKLVAIEEQRPMHKQGVTSTFSTGRSYGILEGIVAALRLPYEIIRPTDWQKVMFRGLPKGKGKVMSVKIAQQLYPKQNFLKSDRCVKVHDGMTDAVLIAEYTRRKTIV